MRHRLFILAASGRQLIADAVQGLSHITMAENGPDTPNKAFSVLIHLNRKPADHGLRCRQANSLCRYVRNSC